MTTLFAHAESVKAPVIEIVPATRKKHSLLPVLTVLFLISYGLMTMLIVEQGRTIDSQRALIRELFRDSRELAAVRHHQQEVVPAIPDSQTPSGQIPSTQAPRKQAPSSQTDPQVHSQNETGAQKPYRMPSRPASDLSDRARALILI